MPNDERHALRYLLLRFLRSARPLVAPDVHDAVVTSLRVDETADGPVVTWIRDGREFRKTYRADEFQFYGRGDIPDRPGIGSNKHRPNAALAREFVQDALGVSGFNEEIRTEPHFPRMVWSVVGYAAAAALMGLAGGRDFAMAAAMLLLLPTLEFWYGKGKLIVAPLASMFVVIGLPWTAIVTGAVYVSMHLLDPDRWLRRLRTLLALSVVVYGALEAVRNHVTPQYGAWVGLIAALGVVAFVVRWTSGSHFRSFPLAFPFLCIGLSLDGRTAPAMVGVGCALLAALLSHEVFRFSPIQGERTLTPNG